jgi:hypothetical protein
MVTPFTIKRPEREESREETATVSQDIDIATSPAVSGMSRQSKLQVCETRARSLQTKVGCRLARQSGGVWGFVGSSVVKVAWSSVFLIGELP